MKNKYNPKGKVKCLLCNGEMRYLLTGYDYLYKTTKKKFNVYKCLNCKSEQIIPMPKNNELMSFYPLSYYSYNVSSKNSCEKGFFMKVREKLIELSYNSDTKKDVYCYLALLARPFFRGLPLRQEGNKNFLDVGCGDGYNVDLMSRYGWNAVGFEVGNKGKHENIYYDSDFSNVDFDGILFDYIRVWHVLEHVPNPDEFVEKLASILSANGKILIGVPNTASLYAIIFGRYWYNRDLPRHVINYNPVSLGELVKKHGLKILKLSYNSAGGFLGSIQHLLNYGKFRLNINLINNIFLFALFYPIDMICNFFKLGDCISITLVKKTYIFKI